MAEHADTDIVTDTDPSESTSAMPNMPDSPAREAKPRGTGTPEPTLDEKWTTGDFTLVSSDNVVFKVESFYLFAASAVFRDGLNVATPPLNLELTDSDIETAAVIRYFLSLVIHGKVLTVGDDLVTAVDAQPLLKLVRFLLKYSCASHIEHLNNWLQARRKSGILVFTVAALQDDTAWCCKALKEDKSTWAANQAIYARDTGKSDRNKLDPSGAPLWFCEILPRHYLWALCRAWGHVPEPKRRVDRAAAFEKFLKSAKNSNGMGAHAPYQTGLEPPRTCRSQFKAAQCRH